MIATLILAGIALLAGAGAIVAAMGAVGVLYLLDKWQDRDYDDDDPF